MDAVGFQLENQVGGGFLTAGEKITEAVELVGGDAVAGIGSAVIVLDYPECCTGGSADADDQRLRGNVSGIEIDGLGDRVMQSREGAGSRQNLFHTAAVQAQGADRKACEIDGSSVMEGDDLCAGTADIEEGAACQVEFLHGTGVAEKRFLFTA